MGATKFLFGAVLVGVVTTVASANEKGPRLQDRQQAACYDDVQRLCGSAMPDVNKVTDCMKDKKPSVSAKCAAMWDIKN